MVNEFGIGCCSNVCVTGLLENTLNKSSLFGVTVVECVTFALKPLSSIANKSSTFLFDGCAFG